MAAASGFNTQICVGDEAIWGTAVARTGLVNCMAVNDRHDIPKIEMARLDGLYEEADDEADDTPVGLPVLTLAGRYGGAWLKFLKHLFGSVTTTTPDITSAPTARQHDFAFVAALLPGLSLEAYKELATYLYAGCKVQRLTLGFRMRGGLTVGINLVGKAPTTTTKTTGLTATTAKLIRGMESVVTWNAGVITVTDLSFDFNLATNPQMGLGFAAIGQPRKEAKTVISGNMTVEYESTALYDDFVAATTRQLLVTCTGPVIAGAYYNQFILTGPVTKLLGEMPTAPSVAPLAMRIPFRCRVDASNTLPMTLRVINTDTAI